MGLANRSQEVGSARQLLVVCLVRSQPVLVVRLVWSQRLMCMLKTDSAPLMHACADAGTARSRDVQAAASALRYSPAPVRLGRRGGDSPTSRRSRGGAWIIVTTGQTSSPARACALAGLADLSQKSGVRGSCWWSA